MQNIKLLFKKLCEKSFYFSFKKLNPFLFKISFNLFSPFLDKLYYISSEKSSVKCISSQSLISF